MGQFLAARGFILFQREGIFVLKRRILFIQTLYLLNEKPPRAVILFALKSYSLKCK